MQLLHFTFFYLAILFAVLC